MDAETTGSRAGSRQATGADPMTTGVILAYLARLLLACLAIAVVGAATRVFDAISGRKFKDARALMEEQPVAVGLYYGLRYLGTCLVVAACFLL
jgi:hypothetical protein